jgi:hypothetical protein
MGLRVFSKDFENMGVALKTLSTLTRFCPEGLAASVSA